VLGLAAEGSHWPAGPSVWADLVYNLGVALRSVSFACVPRTTRWDPPLGGNAHVGFLERDLAGVVTVTRYDAGAIGRLEVSMRP